MQKNFILEMKLNKKRVTTSGFKEKKNKQEKKKYRRERFYC